MTIDQVMNLAPVIPVLVVDNVEQARPIAEALVAGGLRAVEVTLRTPAALEAIAVMATVPGAVIGAGTVVGAAQVAQAADAGARFIVSPGLTAPVVEAAQAASLPILPGVATAADIMRGLDLGLTRFKFFPATTAGGIPALRALAAPFFQCRFCPTGGITSASVADWLALDEVACVGGSWIVAAGAGAAQIERNARDAAALSRSWKAGR